MLMPKNKNYLVAVVIFSLILLSVVAIFIVISKDAEDDTNSGDDDFSEQPFVTEVRRTQFAQSLAGVEQQLQNNEFVYNNEKGLELLRVIEFKVVNKEEDLALQYANFMPDDEISSHVENKYSLIMRLYVLLDSQAKYTEYRNKLRDNLTARRNDEYALRVLQNFDSTYPEVIVRGVPNEDE